MAGGVAAPPASETPEELDFQARQLERQIAVRVEQVKLRATALNLIAVGFVVTGIIAPIAQVAAGISERAITGQAILMMVIWFLLAIILHYGALLAIRSLP